MDKTVAFALLPAGLFGMVTLGRHLDDLKRRGLIGDWHPERWDSYRKERARIRFDSADDAATAISSWKHPAE